MTAGRHRAAVCTLLALVTGALALVFGPFEIAAIRLGPLSLLWWYAVVAAPLGAVATVVATLSMTKP